MFFLELESQPFALNTNGNIITYHEKKNASRLMEKWPTWDFCNCNTWIIFFFKRKFHRKQEWTNNTFVQCQSIFLPLTSINIYIQLFTELCIAQIKNHDDKIFNRIFSMRKCKWVEIIFSWLSLYGVVYLNSSCF